MQCPEFPLFISLELTSSTFFALSLSSSLLQRLLSSPSFLSLSFSRRKIHIFRQAMQRVSREADVRPTNCFSPRVQCSFLRRFRNRLLFTRDMKCFALLLHALLPRGYTPSTRLRVGGGGVDVVNAKEIWKLLVDNVTVLRQYVLSYR